MACEISLRVARRMALLTAAVVVVRMISLTFSDASSSFFIANALKLTEMALVACAGLPRSPKRTRPSCAPHGQPGARALAQDGRLFRLTGRERSPRVSARQLPRRQCCRAPEEFFSGLHPRHPWERDPNEKQPAATTFTTPVC